MPRYPNSECDAHRNVKTSEPVCIVCMNDEIEKRNTLIDAIEKSVKQNMSSWGIWVRDQTQAFRAASGG